MPRWTGLFMDAPAVGLRHADERRRHERRDVQRPGTDRRRHERRRLKLRSALFSLLTLALPTSAKLTPLAHVVRPSVSTAVTSFDPISPKRAYEHLIREASSQYDVDPALIRSVIQTESAFDAMAVSPA